jgi:hypothetical protein
MERFIREAQTLDLQPLLGYKLLKELIEDYEASPSLNTAIYSNLYNGVEYDCGGNATYYCEGVAIFLAYATYYRIIRENSFNVTAFGVVQKNDQNSEPLSDERLSGLISMVKEKVDYYRKSIKDFLCEENSLYTSYYPEKKRTINYKLIGD